MRKIKFRAKRLDNGKWVFGVPIPNSYGDRVFFIPLLLTDKIAYPFERLVDWVVEVIPGTIGQYTGTKDKYGIEIYEGNVVVIENHPFEKKSDSDVGIKIEGRYVIGWNEDDLTWVAGSFILSKVKNYTRVIGNSYEIPGLSEGTE